MNPDKSNTFCYFPFSQLALKDWDAGHGLVNVAPCCNTARRFIDTLGLQELLKSDKTITPEQIFFSKPMNALRQDMLNGIKNPICNTCWKSEAQNPSNPWSPRIYSYLPDKDDFDYTNPRLQAIDFGLGENCNLRCRMCVPELSNKLRIDQKFAYESGFKKVSDEATIGFTLSDSMPDHLKSSTCHTDVLYFERDSAAWQWVMENIRNLRMIRATGGEIFVEKAYIELLDEAIKQNTANKIVLHFHTNATKFSNSIIQKLIQFKSLEPNLSIDSVGKNYEYIRYPMTWKKLEANVNKLLSEVHHNISNLHNNIAYSSLNAHFIFETYNWLASTIYSTSKYNKMFSLNISDVMPYRKGINICNLPKTIRRDIIKLLEKTKTENKKHEMILCNDIDYNITLHKNSLDKDYNREESALKFYEEVYFFDCSRNQHYADYLHSDVIEFLDEGKQYYEARKG